MADTVFENVCNVLAAVESDADLTARQFTFVKIKNTGVVDETIRVEATTVLGEQAFGVLQDKPVAGEAATVAATGSVTKVFAGEAIPAGSRITTAADGRAVAVVANEYDMGYSLTESTAAGQLIGLYLDPAGRTGP